MPSTRAVLPTRPPSWWGGRPANYNRPNWSSQYQVQPWIINKSAWIRMKSRKKRSMDRHNMRKTRQSEFVCIIALMWAIRPKWIWFYCLPYIQYDHCRDQYLWVFSHRWHSVLVECLTLRERALSMFLRLSKGHLDARGQRMKTANTKRPQTQGTGE